MAVARRMMAPDGPEVSQFIHGFWRLVDWDMTAAACLDFTKALLDLGITTLDHADIYGDYECERRFGAALALEPGLRQRMELITKCDIKLTSGKYPRRRLNHYDTSYAHIVASAEASLRHLRTDYLDVLLLHRPDPLMDADEVARAFFSLHERGLVRYFGVSNFTPSQYALLADRLPFALVTNQVECSVLNFEVMQDGTLDQCQQHRIAPMAWSPFGGGRLFGSDQPKANRLRAVMRELGQRMGGAPLDQLALAWLLRHPAGILPILGTGRLDRVRSALQAASIELDRQAWFEIWRAAMGHDVP